MNAVKKTHTIRFNVRGKSKKVDGNTAKESYLLHVPKGENVSIKMTTLMTTLANSDGWSKREIGSCLLVFDGDKMLSACSLVGYFFGDRTLRRAVRKKLRKRGWTKVAGTGEMNDIWLPPQTK